MSGRGWMSGLAAVVLAAGAGGMAGCAGHGGGVGNSPPSADAQFVRGRDLYQKGLNAQKAGRKDEAIELYREAVQVAPKMFQAWNNLGVLYMEKQNYAEAGLALRSAADLAPSDPVPVENLALAYYRAGYAKKALDYSIEAIERDPNRVEGYRGAYKASEQLGLRDSAALERVEKALLVETDPAWRELYLRKRVWLSNEPGNEKAER